MQVLYVIPTFLQGIHAKQNNLLEIGGKTIKLGFKTCLFAENVSVLSFKQ